VAVDGWAVTFGTARPGLAAAPLSPFIAVPNVTAHPSTASVPITVLLYNGPLFCGFNVAIIGVNENNINVTHFISYRTNQILLSSKWLVNFYLAPAA